MTADPKAVKQAEAHVKNANKQEKKSVFHKPEFGDAASSYNKAADIFIRQNMYHEAKCCYERAAVNYDQDGQSLKAGETYSLAAKAAFLKNDPNESLRLLRECKVAYLEGDQGMQAIRQMKDFAQKIKETDPEVSYKLYDELLEVIETEGKYHWEKDSFVDFALLCYDMKKWKECFEAWERAKKAFLALKNTDGAAHCILSAVAIHLQRNDIVAAKNVIDAAMQEDYFIRSQDFNCIDMIYRGVKNHDGDLLEIGQKNIILGFIKPEISRIICSFDAPKSEPEEDKTKKPAAAPPPKPKPKPKPAVVKPPQKENDDDEVDDAEKDAKVEAEEKDEEEEQKKEEEEQEDWLL